ncbi:MAG: DUF6600 domain-containing protein [Thermoanaerobaculia bacterium]
MKTTRRLPASRTPLGLALGVALALLPAAAASAEDDAGIRQTVARISYTSGSVAFSRGDDPDNWQEAMVNVPLTIGDRLWTENDARVELEAPGARLFVAPGTQLSILDLREDVAQFSLSVGTAAFRIHHLAEGETFEVDTPNAAVTLRTPGRYRIRVDEDGDTRIDVTEGSAVAAVGSEVAELHGGDGLRVRGLEGPVYELEALATADSWDRWVDERTGGGRIVVSAHYVGGGIAGIEELDAHGQWERIPEYGWVWSPRSVDAGWTPYQDGRWIWQDPWGWTWVSREPWGWAPYHYGSWVFFSSRWCWVPVGPRVRVVPYAPARVVFVGAGPGGAVVAAGSMAFVGWFPVHPRDRFVPWWGPRVSVSVTNVTYVNRTYVTVISRETFVGGANVRETHVRDARVIREVSAAPVFRGPIPLVPTMASIRFATPAQRHDLPHPPERFLDRRVATSLPPPPRPPAFSAKLDFIQKNHGQPYHRPDMDRRAPDRQGDVHTTAAPAGAPRETRSGKPEARPSRDAGGPKEAPVSRAIQLEPTRPPRPSRTPGETRRYESKQTPTPGAARPQAREMSPAVRSTPRPSGPVAKAPTPVPTPRPRAEREQHQPIPHTQGPPPQVQKAPAEKQAISKAPPEKKPTPGKKDEHKEHPPQPN